MQKQCDRALATCDLSMWLQMGSPKDVDLDGLEDRHEVEARSRLASGVPSVIKASTSSTSSSRGRQAVCARSMAARRRLSGPYGPGPLVARRTVCLSLRSLVPRPFPRSFPRRFSQRYIHIAIPIAIPIAVFSSLSSIAILTSLLSLTHYPHNLPVALFVAPLDASTNCRDTSAHLVDAQPHNSSLLPLDTLSQHPLLSTSHS